MPKSWYIFSENLINEDDSDEVIEQKTLNQQLCAHKKPYFFQYNYLSLKRDYDKYVKVAQENAISIYKKTLDELLSSECLTNEEQSFVENYRKKLPLDISPSVMNKICWAVEKETDDLSITHLADYDCYDLHSYAEYNEQTYNIIKLICDNYRSATKKESKNILTQNENSTDFSQNMSETLEYYIQEMHIECPNEEVLCDILMDLCYKKTTKHKYSKEILWAACGNVIVDRLLKSHNYKMKYPVKSNNPDFVCCGTGFEMQEIVYKDGEEDDLFI